MSKKCLPLAAGPWGEGAPPPWGSDRSGQGRGGQGGTPLRRGPEILCQSYYSRTGPRSSTLALVTLV